MCTCSWIRTPDGYDLLFNRDESRLRAPAFLPRLLVRNHARYLAPIDPDGGGTWLGVNAFGLSVALLNRYPGTDLEAPPAPAQPISRGLLVRNMLDARDPAEIRTRIDALDLARFQPFTLLTLQTARPALLFEWTGVALMLDADADQRMPLASAGLDTLAVLTYRADLLDQMATSEGRTVETLRRFHLHQDPARPVWGPCMEHSEARTVSFSHVQVRPDLIRFGYTPGSPCEAGALRFEVSMTPAPPAHKLTKLSGSVRYKSPVSWHSDHVPRQRGSETGSGEEGGFTLRCRLSSRAAGRAARLCANGCARIGSRPAPPARPDWIAAGGQSALRHTNQ